MLGASLSVLQAVDHDGERPTPVTAAVSHPSVPPLSRSLTPIDDFISGITAGSLSTLLLHPFDLIKTRMQLQGSALPSSVSSSPTSVLATVRPPMSSLSTARGLVVKEGWRSLWKGLTPNLVGNTVAWGSYFFLYNQAKARLQSWKGGRELRTTDYLACACVTGVAVQAMTNPLWVVKTRSFLDEANSAASSSSARPSLLCSLSALWREEGVRGLYRGFLPALFGVSHGAVQFMVYEETKKAWRRVKTERQRRRRKELDLSHLSATSTLAPPSSASLLPSPPPPAPAPGAPFTALETVCMAIASKTVASVTTYPYQVVRTHMQSRSIHPPYASTWDCVLRVWRASGVRGFYRGVVVSTVKVIPNACAVFVIYEHCSHALQALAAQHVHVR